MDNRPLAESSVDPRVLMVGGDVHARKKRVRSKSANELIISALFFPSSNRIIPSNLLYLVASMIF